MKKLLLVALSILMAATVFAAGGQEERTDGKIKAGFIYVGPTADFGWSYAHEEVRKMLEEKYDWFDSVYIESVPEGDAGRYIDRLINEEKCDIIFTTSFGYMDATVKAAEMYPDVTFMHCSGYKQAPNLGTYFSELYQMYYLNGLMAGAMTETDKVGYVAAFPTPELVRHIDAYALGVKATNPDAKVDVRWTYAWYGPEKAREAAQALVAAGSDVLAFTEDTPAVVEVGQELMEEGKNVYTFSHYTPMQSYGEDTLLSGQISNWFALYDKILTDYKNGTWSNEDLWWLAKEDAARLGASENVDELVNPKYVETLKAKMVETPDLGTISVYDLVVKRYAQMKEGRESFDPYVGPLYDNEGNLQLSEGTMATKDQLLSMMYYVDNVLGSVPSE
ncbi:BMP family ABC transporter substrate-binding protein [Spirochaeta cellobiosiphila]|uniref:BMP family ABC transporter substrate-binding protein n=1 Tax=Spirochaeta cellobiosiphila TaxID=504483 RepID=UPI00040C9023|nr:BMP family ABC transporter substrate-binding protein [Spirochaeta cellobiosiphila]